MAKIMITRRINKNQHDVTAISLIANKCDDYFNKKCSYTNVVVQRS